MNIQEVKRTVDVGYMDEKELCGILDWLIEQAEEVDRLRSELEGIVYLGHSMQPEHSAEDVLGCIIKSARKATYIEEDED